MGDVVNVMLIGVTTYGDFLVPILDWVEQTVFGNVINATPTSFIFREPVLVPNVGWLQTGTHIHFSN